jgi:antitoxin HigA-1
MAPHIRVLPHPPPTLTSSRQLPITDVMKPRHPVHPGKMLLEEFLRPMCVRQRQFAAKLGWTPARLNELVNGKRTVTADAALDLAKALGTSPEVWMNLQMTWDLRRAEMRRR